jgi:hypothetical protein
MVSCAKGENGAKNRRRNKRRFLLTVMQITFLQGMRIEIFVS